MLEIVLSGRIKAITFDLWDTLFADDSDEQKRAAQGLPPKSQARPQAIHEALSRHHDVSFEAVALAYRTTDAAFRAVWHELHVTWTVPQRLVVLFDGLGMTLPEADFNAVTRTLEDMEVVVPPSPVPGAAAALAELKKHYALAVVSDAIVSPGRALRDLLKNHDLLGYFDAFVFSDEVGCSKPQAPMFRRAAEALGVELSDMVHVGDRNPNDVKGPQALGARAVLFTGVKDRGKNTTTADAVCERYEDLPGIIASLDGA
jgi:putative hydrolase of the HAD superfamily